MLAVVLVVRKLVSCGVYTQLRGKVSFLLLGKHVYERERSFEQRSRSIGHGGFGVCLLNPICIPRVPDVPMPRVARGPLTRLWLGAYIVDAVDNLCLVGVFALLNRCDIDPKYERGVLPSVLVKHHSGITLQLSINLCALKPDVL